VPVNDVDPDEAANPEGEEEKKRGGGGDDARSSEAKD